jgi:hypothetical protein
MGCAVAESEKDRLIGLIADLFGLCDGINQGSDSKPREL